jgi:hypothetical protein
VTTLAGSWGNPSLQGDDTPTNRAVDALLAAEFAATPLPAGDPMAAEMAAGDIANAIVAGRGLLTVRERMVLAAALLPEFDRVDP